MSRRPVHKPCAGCKGTRLANRAVCYACWQKVPADLRRALNAARQPDEHRAAVRAVIEHVTAQPAIPGLL